MIAEYPFAPPSKKFSAILHFLPKNAVRNIRRPWLFPGSAVPIICVEALLFDEEVADAVWEL
jgi:hypothetical protein